MKADTTRFIPNPYPDIDGTFSEEKTLELIKSQLEMSSNILESNYPAGSNRRVYSTGKTKEDYSLYTGSGGNILVYYTLYELYSQMGVTEAAKTALTKAITSLKANMKIVEKTAIHKQSVSFYEGGVGVYTLGCLIYDKIGDNKSRDFCYSQVLNYSKYCTGEEAEDEILYGNAGYLYSLLFLHIYNPELFSPKEQISEVLIALIEEGRSTNKDGLLLYFFPRHKEKLYFGGAHGQMGIYYMLFMTLLKFPLETLPNISTENQKYLVEGLKESTKFMLECQFKTGNFPSSHGSESDKLIHFCHGATGAVPFLLSAYKYFGEDELLKRALKAGEAVWARGIIKKGNGLCHGITGNAYPLFALYRETKDEKWKYRGYMMALASFDNKIQGICEEYKDAGRMRKGIPDTPYSLMEGMGGTVVLYAQLLMGTDQLKFPGYEL